MMTATNRVLVFQDKKTRGLANVTALVEGTGKDGKPVKGTALLASLKDALESEYDCDAHVVSYYLTEPEGGLAFPRITKPALAQIRALGGDVMCSTVFVDVDLYMLLGKKEKLPWTALSEEEEEEVWAKLIAQVPGLPAPAAVYKTQNGARLVHPLAFDVKAGAAFEAVLARVHRAYLNAGVFIDESCSDWTRLYRLPFVIRDGEPTVNQPWFAFHQAEPETDIYLIPEAEDLDQKDDATIVRHEACSLPDVPTDEECHTLLFDDRTKPLPVLKTLRQKFREHPLGPYITGQNAVIPEGKRNDTIVKLAGLLARTDTPVQVCYAVIVESIKLLPDQSEPWRDVAWAKLIEYRARTEAEQRAKDRVVPDRLKSKTAPTPQEEPKPEDADEPELDPETGLRVLPEAETRAAWLDEALSEDILAMNEKGSSVLPTARNAAVMLQRLDHSIHRDIFAECVQVVHDGKTETLNDYHLLDLKRQFAETGFHVPKDQFFDLIKTVANAHHKHPVRDYLIRALRSWDGKPRVERWLSTYFGVEDNEYTRCVGAVTLVGGVRRVFEPGCKHDTMLILEGGQGGFKSTALRALAVREAWFTDNMRVDATSREIIETVSGHWIVEAAEMIGVRKGDTDRLKSALSRSKERARMAYGQTVNEYQRQFLIFGTTNHEQYLNDNTGNRRFWPVVVGDVDIDALKRDRDNLWGEAVALWQRGLHYVMPPELYELAAVEQEKRRTLSADPDYEIVQSVLGEIEAGIVEITAVWKAIGMNNAGKRAVAIRQTLREMGWVKTGRLHYTKGTGELPVYDVQALGDGAFKMRKTKETRKVS